MSIYLKSSFSGLLFLLAVEANAQIEISPASQIALNYQPAAIKTLDKRPFWIGVGDLPNMYFDSSLNHKIALGAFYRGNAPFSRVYFQHAKFHIRHNASLSNNNEGRGPHLLLDEATFTNAAVLRFRQSMVQNTNPLFPLGEQTLILGPRFWDIRGYANGDQKSQDWLRFVNSDHGSVLSIMGDGKVGINEIAPKADLDVNGYSILGNEGPKIKTKVIDMLLPSSATGCNFAYTILPTTLDKIVSITAQSIDLNWTPQDPLGEAYSYPPFNQKAGFAYYYEILQTKGLAACTGSGTATAISSEFVQGDTLRFFIVFTE
jgi:hypothetical protein